MKFLRNNWFYFAMIAFALIALYAVAFMPNFDTVQRLLLVSLMILPLHQAEEYIFPGGGPVVINRYFYGNKESFRAYPGNWNSVMVVNLSAYIFYLLAFLFPQLIWLGLGTILFNLYQVLGHCIQMNLKMKSWYNPGAATSLFLLLPVSVYFLATVINSGSLSVLDWIFGVASFLLMLAFCVIVPIQLMKDKNSAYPIPQQQVDSLEKVCKWACLRKHTPSTRL